MQNITARSAMTSIIAEPTVMPIVAPAEISLSDSVDWALEDWGELSPDPEWRWLSWDLPGDDGGVCGGVWGAGLFSKEFPSYLFIFSQLS